MMANTPPSKADMLSLLAEERRRLDATADGHLTPMLVDPKRITLYWEYGDYEPCTAWVVADLGERNVGIAYCLGGFGSLGSPWGLVFLDDHHFGQDSGWYPSLPELLTDWLLEKDH